MMKLETINLKQRITIPDLASGQVGVLSLDLKYFHTRDVSPNIGSHFGNQ